jgi:tetratricopeptide (TPR) repeat protein
MKGTAFFLAFALFCYPAAAQQSSTSSPQVKTASLMPGLGDLHHPVSTKNSAAQKFFDQGLQLIYAFNHDEAARSFQHAADDILKIADNLLAAKIAMAQRDSASAISTLYEAVAVQDALNYGEPPDWFFPVRESLGAVLLLNDNAVEAEKVFREDLQRNPRNPRSLFGLRESLKAQKRDYDAHFVDTQFRAAWKAADTQLSVQELGT